ncbi:sulfatase [bacterium]|nr:sulfatase [bacterium]
MTDIAHGVLAALTATTIIGAADALRALRRNTYVHLSRYVWLYLSVPIVALAPVALVFGTLSAAGTGALGASRGATAATAVVVCLVAAGCVEAAAFRRQLDAGLRAARVPRHGEAWARRAATAVWVVLLACAGVAGGQFVARLPDVAVTTAGAVVAAVNFLLTLPAVAFLMSELRRAPRRREGARHRRSRAVEPSLVLISIDTLRADRLGAYGATTRLTPSLDALAARGTVCDTAIATSSWTLPSVASFLTGRYPSRHGAGESVNGFDLMGRSPLRPGVRTLAEAFADAGYGTCAVVSNPYLALQYGLGRGFSSYENVSIESEAMVAIRGTLAGRTLEWMLGSRPVDTGTRVSDVGIRRLRRAASVRREDGQPFFLRLHYIDPHAPYGCAGDKSFRGDTLLSDIRHEGPLGQRFEAVARLRAGEIRLNATEKADLVALYDAGVAAVDAAVGRVFDELTALGLADEVIVALVSDHGEEFWEHGGVEHGHTFYDELVHVPLMFAGPGVPRGGRVRSLVSLADLPPTLLRLAGLSAPHGLDGVPIALSDASAEDDRVVRCESLLFAEPKVAVRTRSLKYVLWQGGKEELFDLDRDPCELRDLAATADLGWARGLLGDGPGPPQGSYAAALDTASLRVAMERLGYA